MKKIVLSLFTIVLLITSVHFTGVEAKESKTTTQEYHGISEKIAEKYSDHDLNDQPLTPYEYYQTTSGKNPILKAVLIVINILGAMGTIVDTYKEVRYLYNYQPNWDAVEAWSEENGVSMSNIQASITAVIYDNGCYSTYFPANPYC